ncbi:MAG: hypothetical protein AAF438_23305, partial [Pseudomonadota bacterium]
PICPAHRGVDYELTKNLTVCLKVIPKPPNSISSPLQVLEMLQAFSYCSKRCRLVSLDVEAMFPSTPTGPAIHLIRNLLKESQDALSDVTSLKPDSVADLLDLSIRNCHAVVEDDGKQRWFRQTKGLAMRKSYSPLVADIFMGMWEKDLQELASACGSTVIHFCRYADDYLILFEGTDEALHTWVEKLNTKDVNIKVTLEVEQAGQLPFLDISITRTEHNFKTKVYRKACATNQVAPFTSYTEPRNLTSAIESDTVRAFRYCTTSRDRQKELQFITKKYEQQGYPSTTIHTTL